MVGMRVLPAGRGSLHSLVWTRKETLHQQQILAGLEI